VLRDLSYGPDPVWNTLDLFVPAQHSGKLPVLINVHGGGWVWGSKEYTWQYCSSLCAFGFAVVSSSYRLAPESLFPAQLEDVNAVVHYITDHADELGLDKERICMVGDSAGAHIAAMYACTCTNPACNYGFQPPEGFRINAIGLNCGVYDLANCRSELIQSLIPSVFSKDASLEQQSPVTWLTEKFPPAFLITAKGDFLREQTPLLEQKLSELGVPCVCREYGTESEPLTHDFQCDLNWKQAETANREECKFLMRYVSQGRNIYV